MLYKRERSLKDAILQASQPALLATTGGKSKAYVLGKLHNHSYHVFVWQGSEQVRSQCQIQGVSKKNGPILNCSPDHKSSLFFLK